MFTWFSFGIFYAILISFNCVKAVPTVNTSQEAGKGGDGGSGKEHHGSGGSDTPAGQGEHGNPAKEHGSGKEHHGSGGSGTPAGQGEHGNYPKLYYNSNIDLALVPDKFPESEPFLFATAPANSIAYNVQKCKQNTFSLIILVQGDPIPLFNKDETSDPTVRLNPNSNGHDVRIVWAKVDFTKKHSSEDSYELKGEIEGPGKDESYVLNYDWKNEFFEEDHVNEEDRELAVLNCELEIKDEIKSQLQLGNNNEENMKKIAEHIRKSNAPLKNEKYHLPLMSDILKDLHGSILSNGCGVNGKKIVKKDRKEVLEHYSKNK